MGNWTNVIVQDRKKLVRQKGRFEVYFEPF